MESSKRPLTLCSSLPWFRDLKTHDYSALYIFLTSFLVLHYVPSLPQAKTREPTRWANHIRIAVHIRSEESHIPDLLNQHNVFTHDLISLLAMAVLDIHAVATKHQQNSSPQTFIVTCQMKLGSRNRFFHHWKRTGYDIWLDAYAVSQVLCPSWLRHWMVLCG